VWITEVFGTGTANPAFARFSIWGGSVAALPSQFYEGFYTY